MNNKINEIISPENQLVLQKRLKSLVWRGGMLGLAGLLSFALSSLELLNLPPLAVAVLGLALGELSKELNRRLSA